MATTTSRWHSDRPTPGAAAQRQAIRDGERVRVKMRVAQGVWSADRYRRAQAAFRAAADADPLRRDLWETESRYAQTMQSALQRQVAEPSAPRPLVPAPTKSLTPAARQAIADGERVLKKMIEKDGEWTAIRYGKAMAAFKAAAKADPVRRRDWQKAIEYAARMADKGDN
jgi:tetratricopeptide (TPR) repeat protein